jgi:hypothetical protein
MNDNLGLSCLVVPPGSWRFAGMTFAASGKTSIISAMCYKFQRSARVTWNPLTRHLDPLVCESCRATIRRVHPAASDAAILLLCPSCSQRLP